MSLEFIKHDRPVTTHDLQKYGKYATHDIRVPFLLAYELGEINANTEGGGAATVIVDEAFIKKTMVATNKRIKNRFDSPFKKLKGWLDGKSIEEIELIPLIEDHNTSKVERLSGYSQGLLYIEKIEGVQSLLCKVLVMRPETKKDLEGGLLRCSSIGTRRDGSIKEISFVVNPAVPEGGPLFSEGSPKTSKTDSQGQQLSERDIQLTEKISTLEFEEQELNDTIIPNHMVLSRLIKTGRLQPWKYKELIKTKNTEALQLMESSTVGHDLGLMLGTYCPPADLMASSDDDVIIKGIIDKYKNGKTTTVKNSSNKKGKKEKTQIVAQTDPFIKKSIDFEQMRKKELESILELSEHSPEIAQKYLKTELGQSISGEEFYNDKYLKEYVKKSTEIREKIGNLKIQLGEH